MQNKLRQGWEEEEELWGERLAGKSGVGVGTQQPCSVLSWRNWGNVAARPGAVSCLDHVDGLMSRNRSETKAVPYFLKLQGQ